MQGKTITRKKIQPPQKNNNKQTKKNPEQTNPHTRTHTHKTELRRRITISDFDKF